MLEKWLVDELSCDGGDLPAEARGLAASEKNCSVAEAFGEMEERH